MTARDAAGQAVSVKSEVAGQVEGVDLSGEVPNLIVGATRVPLANVKSVGLGN